MGSNQLGYSFCMITDGKEPDKTEMVIRCLSVLNIPDSELIVCGRPDIDWTNLYKPFWVRWRPELADAGRLGAMRNDACGVASYDKLVVIDDDIWFRPDWYKQMINFGDDWDVLSCTILNPDNTRFWDWKTYKDGVNKLLDYDKISPDISITGGFICMKKYVFDRVLWDYNRGFYQAEDVDYTERLKAAGFRIGINPAAVVYHLANYTQRGDFVYRIEDT